MKYKISRNNLQKALNEAVLQKKDYYKNLTFIDEIFKEEKEHVKTIKNIIRFKGKNISERLHHYLLHECNCSSKYDKVAKHTNMSPEKDLLYDFNKSDLYENDYDEDIEITPEMYEEYTKEYIEEDDFQGYDYDEDKASYSDDHRYEEVSDFLLKRDGVEPSHDDIMNHIDSLKSSEKHEYEDYDDIWGF